MKQGQLQEAPNATTLKVEYQRKLLFTQVKVNGSTKRFAFDTGAPCVITPELKEELGLKVIAEHNIQDSHGKTRKLEFVRLEKFEIGEVVFKNTIAIVADLSGLKCYPMDGLIGANAMRHLDWYFDLLSEEAVAYLPAHSDTAIADRTLNLPFGPNVQGTPKLNVLIPGMKRPVSASFDMGSTGSITLKGQIRELAAMHTEHSWVYGKTSRSIYGTRMDTSHYFIADTAKVGGFTFYDKTAKNGGSNLIGNSFWQDFRFLLSWKDKKVYLAPRISEAHELPKNALVLGQENDSVRVMGIRESGADLPISLGEVIVEMNGIDLNALTEAERCELSKRNWDDVNLKVLKKDGRIEEIILPASTIFE